MSGVLRLLGVMLAVLAVTACATRRPAPVYAHRPFAFTPPPPPARPYRGPCDGPASAEQAAALNASSLDTLPWSPFGRLESGWRIYSPMVAHEVGARCPPDSPGFAAALAAWKVRRGLPDDGAMNTETFMAMKQVWNERRPFLMLRTQGVCPAAPDEATLAQSAPEENRFGKLMFMRPGTLDAYRRMTAAARREVPELRDDPSMLTLFSAYRSPAHDAQRCAVEKNCQGIVRAQCSAHRTGLALDMVVGWVPGLHADDSSDTNRRVQTQTAAYEWLVWNADRFGFVPYVFEPWHWEWTGEAP